MRLRSMRLRILRFWQIPARCYFALGFRSGFRRIAVAQGTFRAYNP
jgi:hypothetical protein